MHSGTDIPRVGKDTLLKDALMEISNKGLGMTTVVDASGALLGVFTDGDLRRSLDSNKNIHITRICEVMSAQGKKISENALATEAANLMQENSIYTLLVVNAENELSGIIRMHDLLQANVL